MENSLTTHEIECDKCGGTGKNYQQTIRDLLKRWRKSLGITQREIATVCRISFSEYCKFENGKLDFGQKRIRKIIQTLENWKTD